MTCKNKCRSTTVRKEVLLDLHHHVARLAWLIQEFLFLVKKQSGPTLKIRTNTEVGLFVPSLIHSLNFIQIQSNI